MVERGTKEGMSACFIHIRIIMLSLFSLTHTVKCLFSATCLHSYSMYTG